MDESPLTEVLMWSEPGGAGGHYTARWEPGGNLDRNGKYKKGWWWTTDQKLGEE